MKSPYLSDLKPNQVFTTTFLVHVKDVRQKKSGEPYLSLVLGDRTGEVDAKMWDNVVEVVDTFERDDFVKVKGLLQIFQNRLQMSVHKMARVLDCDVDFADFFPASARDPLEMFAELRGVAAGVRDPHLRALLNAFLDDEALARRYRTAPAAKHVHHAYLGGLIEHVLSVCRLCRLTSSHYGNVDLDLLLTGAILHDVGKVAELTYERSFGYSTEGQLLGHIVIGLRMLQEKLQQIPDFPPKLRVLVEHLIVSHHGELEYGSPKVPLFPEALLLHHLDNLDSKMECMRALAEKDRHVEGCWTGYNVSLDRSILKKAKYLEDAPAARANQDAPAARANQDAQSARANQDAQSVPANQNELSRGAAPEAAASAESAPAIPQETAVAQAPMPMPAPVAASQSQPQRHIPSPSPFAEKLQQAWRKDS
jgi:3'-5' exoribonuclease